jgi:hypothetical protein
MQIMNGKRQAEWRRNQVLDLTAKAILKRRYPAFCKSVYPLLAGIYLPLEKSPRDMSEDT